jgi:hypothetical protein
MLWIRIRELHEQPTDEPTEVRLVQISRQLRPETFMVARQIKDKIAADSRPSFQQGPAEVPPLPWRRSCKGTRCREGAISDSPGVPDSLNGPCGRLARFGDLVFEKYLEDTSQSFTRHRLVASELEKQGLDSRTPDGVETVKIQRSTVARYF